MNTKAFVGAGVGVIVVGSGVIAYQVSKPTETETPTNTNVVSTNTNTRTNANTVRTNINTSTTNANTSVAKNTNTNVSSGANGTFSATVSYQAPNESNTITVSVTIANDIVQSTTLSSQPGGAQSAQYQAAFKAAYTSKVVGQNINTLNLSRVGGATLTTQAFNNAIAQIKNQL
ncbi:MAG: hypothetical protein KIH62_003550 [Candidatus Kerfeldbacteria bacterium]|nr:hypothetical protein [Candidatus Kerfeldbacteria bacterium]